ncbi:MAG: lipid-A-disaccharide synthase [Paracoccaceae bacterium]
MLVMLVAGEASGDKLGAALMAGLKQLVGDIDFAGVGGAQMQAEGLVSMFPMQELSVMGIAEVLPKYRQLKRRITEVAEEVLRRKPNVLITIDSPDFCLRVAKLVKASSSIRTVHYVAPSVWAWRPGRAAKMAHFIDQVLALLPFEPPYMEAAGMRCDFVGHPVVAEPLVTDAEKIEFRKSFGLGTAPILLVLPGSRRSEVQRLTPVFGKAVRLFLQHHPDFRVLVPAAPHVVDLVRQATADWSGEPVVLDPTDISAAESEHRKRLAFGAANIALAASGTVSLELAAANTPMVIAYDLNWLSWQIMSRMAKIDTVTLVNLVTDSKTVPEFLGPDCTPEKISAALSLLLEDHNDQLKAMRQTMHQLGQNGAPPGLRAARAVLDGLKQQ